MPRHEPYQPHYPSSAESFVRELDRDVEQIQQRTSTPRKTPLFVNREDRDKQPILHRDNMHSKQNAIAQSQMYGYIGSDASARELRRAKLQKKGNISELSEQIDLTIESMRNQLQEHDTFAEEERRYNEEKMRKAGSKADEEVLSTNMQAANRNPIDEQFPIDGQCLKLEDEDKLKKRKRTSASTTTPIATTGRSRKETNTDNKESRI